MNNIQDILNKISTSDIARPEKVGGLTNIGRRKPIYVFYNGVLIETLSSINEAYKKYKRNLVCPAMRRNRPVNGYYFSKTNEYKPRKQWENLIRQQTKIIYKDNKEISFPTILNCAEYLGINRGLLSSIKKGDKKIPKRFSEIKEIIFADSE